jgi:pSer/pThr/pTyr-binding forkhead associated (FHA) protein
MATLVVTAGPAAGKSFPVPRALVLGREKGVDVQIGDAGASREHCKVYSQDGDWFVIDLNSRNGTVVNGQKVSRWHLAHGDVITIGTTKIRFDEPTAKRPEEAAPAAPAARPAAAAAAATAPRGPSAIERERERLRTEAEKNRAQAPRAGADDGSGVVIRETVLQYGRIENKGGLLREDVGQRGGLFRVAMILGLIGFCGLIVWGIMQVMVKEVVEDPDVPEAPADPSTK